MNFKECLNEGIITKSTPDLERSKQLLSMAKTRLKFWDKKIKEEFATLKVEAYYEIIKELIFADMYKNGFTCKNHLCLIAYLKETRTNFDYEISKIDELRQIRNEINYRGFTVTKDYLDRNEKEFLHIIKKLKEL